jgi:hypothetical protein
MPVMLVGRIRKNMVFSGSFDTYGGRSSWSRGTGDEHGDGQDCPPLLKSTKRRRLLCR